MLLPRGVLGVGRRQAPARGARAPPAPAQRSRGWVVARPRAMRAPSRSPPPSFDAGLRERTRRARRPGRRAGSPPPRRAWSRGLLRRGRRPVVGAKRSSRSAGDGLVRCVLLVPLVRVSLRQGSRQGTRGVGTDVCETGVKPLRVRQGFGGQDEPHPAGPARPPGDLQPPPCSSSRRPRCTPASETAIAAASVSALGAGSSTSLSLRAYSASTSAR